jgi:signal transduction histidine kinase
MGLSISNSIIEAHHGTLRFNSKVGNGTTFYFNLPIQTKYNQH